MASQPTSPSADWYKRAFQLDYLRVYQHRNDEEACRQIDFLTRILQLSPPLDIFDLGCGDGRHAIELTKRGYRVTGLDLSEELLERARSRAHTLNLDIEFIQGDMRDIPYTASFDLLVNFFTSFGYFQKDEENLRVLHAIARALRSSGRFLMDYLNRAHVLRTLVPHDQKEMDGIIIEQTRWVTGDPDRAGDHVRINKQVTMTEGDRRRTYEESVRMYTPEELNAMMADAGLTIRQTFGEFDERPVAPDAPRFIIVGSKA